jgi:hypothetical protein
LVLYEEAEFPFSVADFITDVDPLKKHPNGCSS